jgi:choline dehydrogenase-like flavoprotein
LVIYPLKSGLDAWEKLGNSGWNWDILSPYYRKFHTLTLPSNATQEGLALSYIDKKLQGMDGPIQLSCGESDAYTAFNKAWPKTFSNLKHEFTGDPVSGVASGAFTNPCIVNPVSKTRSHAGSEYLNAQVTQRPNLRILTVIRWLRTKR